MAAFVRELCGDYDARTGNYEIFLWGEKAGSNSLAGAYDDECDVNDSAHYAILLRNDIFDFGDCKSVDFADFAVRNGAGVFDGRGGGNTWSRNGSFVVRDETTRFSYCGGRIFWGDETIYCRNTDLSKVGVFDLCSYFWVINCGANKKTEKQKAYAII